MSIMCGRMEHENILHFHDNLDGKNFLDFIACNHLHHLFYHFFQTSLTDDVASPDAALIRMIKYFFGNYLNEFLWEDANIEQLEQKISTSQGRILITHQLVNALDKICEDTMLHKISLNALAVSSQ